jgi:integrase
LTVPVRSEDMVPGDRPGGYSHGVILKLVAPNRLEITVKPCKSHGGRYGTESTTITVDPTVADAPAKYLAQRCHEAGGHLVVSVASKNATRKALRVLGEKALGKGTEAITPSVLRHQKIADLKATFGGGEKVAAASGQSTDRTQSKYGFHQHGRRLKGYVAITSARIPRTGNVARANGLSKSEAPRLQK